MHHDLIAPWLTWLKLAPSHYNGKKKKSVGVCVCVCVRVCGLFGWTHRLYLFLPEISLTSATGESGQWCDMPSGPEGVSFPERIVWNCVCKYWLCAAVRWQDSAWKKVNLMGRILFPIVNSFTICTEDSFVVIKLINLFIFRQYSSTFSSNSIATEIIKWTSYIHFISITINWN